MPEYKNNIRNIEPSLAHHSCKIIIGTSNARIYNNHSMFSSQTSKKHDYSKLKHADVNMNFIKYINPLLKTDNRK